LHHDRVVSSFDLAVGCVQGCADTIFPTQCRRVVYFSPIGNYTTCNTRNPCVCSV